MKVRFTKSIWLTLFAAGFLVNAGVAGHAQANGIAVTQPRVNNNAIQMQMERSQIQTQTYQLQQQLNREQDRQNNMQRPAQSNVPVYHSTCTGSNGVSCN